MGDNAGLGHPATKYGICINEYKCQLEVNILAISQYIDTNLLLISISDEACQSLFDKEVPGLKVLKNQNKGYSDLYRSASN